MRRINQYILVSCLLLVPVVSQAQDDAAFRMEVGGGLGTCFYLGDLNTKFYHQVGPSVGGVWRYLFNPRNALKASLTWGKVKGASDVSIDYYPQNPKMPVVTNTPLKYSFSSHVVDVSCMYELNFWPYGFYEDFMGYKRLTPFIQLGLGVTYLGEDKSLTGNIPLGVGVKYRLSKRWNVALDWSIHFSLSDKMDGLDAPMGIKSEGIKNKDSYQMTLITLTYSFAPICPNCNKD